MKYISICFFIKGKRKAATDLTNGKKMKLVNDEDEDEDDSDDDDDDDDDEEEEEEEEEEDVSFFEECGRE